jgi:hypothetical protein
MQLTVAVGAAVTAVIDGHSATDGANLPAGAKVSIVSNNPSVATVDAIPDLTADAPSVSAKVTVLAGGSTDLHVTVDGGNAGIFEDTATLLVTPVGTGLTHVTITLTSP